MKTKVAKGWFDQEIRAFNWQIRNEPKMITLTETRIKRVKLGLTDKAGCSLEQLQGFLTQFKSELGSASIRMNAFMQEFEPDPNLKSNWIAAKKFVENNIDLIKSAPHNTEFGYYNIHSMLGRLFGIRDRDDSAIYRMFVIIDSCLNNKTNI